MYHKDFPQKDERLYKIGQCEPKEIAQQKQVK